MLETTLQQTRADHDPEKRGDRRVGDRGDEAEKMAGDLVQQPQKGEGANSDDEGGTQEAAHHGDGIGRHQGRPRGRAVRSHSASDVSVEHHQTGQGPTRAPEE